MLGRFTNIKEPKDLTAVRKQFAPEMNTLLDYLLHVGMFKNDAALAKAIDVNPPVISKLRHGTLLLGATYILRMHEVTGVSVAKIKDLAGMPEAKSYFSEN